MVPKEQTANIKAASTICRGIIKLVLCPSGHLVVKTNRSLPWFTIHGLGNWENFQMDQIGNVDDLFRQQLLKPCSIITLDSHCDRCLYEGNSCEEKTRAELDIIMLLPRILIFYIGQRDSTMFNPSSSINFPFIIKTSNSETTLEYRLTGKVFSTSSTGMHFYAKVIRKFGELNGVYKFDDLVFNGKATQISTNPTTLSGKEELTVMAAYTLISSEESYLQYSQERAGNYNLPRKLIKKNYF
jgi:hypothetical protein